MKLHMPETPDADEIEDRKVAQRRLSTYSTQALLVGAKSEQVHILYTDFKQALDISDRLYQLASHLTTPQGALISGPPGSAKTTVANYFIRSLPKSSLFDKNFGVLLIRLRANPSPGLIVSLLLHAVQYPFTQVRQGRVYSMRDIAFDALKQKGTKLIFVDQAHCLANQTRPRRSEQIETAASDILTELMDATGIALVFLADQSFGGLEAVDKALADRISVRHQMRHFSNDGWWLAFLKAFAESFKDIDLMALCKTDIAKLTYTATNGNLRSFRRLSTEAILVAVDAEATLLTRGHLALAYDRIAGPNAARINPYAP